MDPSSKMSLVKEGFSRELYQWVYVHTVSMTLKEYKEKVCPFDKMGEGLKPEEVESKVNLPLNFSFGRIFVFHLHSTELIY
mgnify:CR=1 FL=1